MLVGSFDRPNLVYRVDAAATLEQVCHVIDRHPGESGIVYCIRRKDVDRLCEPLGAGHRALPYHAGMADEDRKASQEAFIGERVDIIVATVAFGMGIDKSNVRYVIHAGMPKSVEHYQQESGRAGRDGLEAECCLLYSAADFYTWNCILRRWRPARATSPSRCSRTWRNTAPASPAGTGHSSNTSARASSQTAAAPATSALARSNTCPTAWRPPRRYCPACCA